MRAAIYEGPRAIVVGERPDPVISEPTDAAGAGRARLRVRVGSVVLPRRLPTRAGPDRPRVHRRRRGHRSRGTRESLQGDLVDRAIHVLRRHLPTLPGGMAVATAPTAARSETTASTADRARRCASRSRMPPWFGFPARGIRTRRCARWRALSDVMCTGHHAADQRRSQARRCGRRDRRRRGRALRRACLVAARRRADHRPQPQPGSPGACPRVRRHRHPRRARRGGEPCRLEMTGGIGVDAALECVGTGQSMATAFAIARPGSIVGAIGAPHDVEVPIDTVIFRNIGLRGGVAPVRRYIPDLLDDVLAGSHQPRARVRLRDRPRRHPGGVRRDGRAPCDQGADPRRDDLMTDGRQSRGVRSALPQRHYR